MLPGAPIPSAKDTVHAWYRASAHPRTLFIWGISGSLLTAGALLDSVAISTHTRGIWPVQAVAGGVGLLLTVSGPVLAIVALLRMLREEAVLMLRGDGLLFVRGRQRIFWAWGELVRVEIEDGRLVLVGEARRWRVDAPFGSTTSEISKKIIEVQRKALMEIV